MRRSATEAAAAESRRADATPSQAQVEADLSAPDFDEEFDEEEEDDDDDQ